MKVAVLDDYHNTVPSLAAFKKLAAHDVKVWNERGEGILPLQVTDKVPRGVVASEKGAWLSTSRTGQTISALVSADLRADLAEGAAIGRCGLRALWWQRLRKDR